MNVWMQNFFSYIIWLKSSTYFKYKMLGMLKIVDN